MSEKNTKFESYISQTTGYSSPIDLTKSDELFKNIKWMTTNEAAFYLRKSANALRTAICRGHLTAYKYRRRLYFKRSDLDKMLETSILVGG